jgi:hypothetical protein
MDKWEPLIERMIRESMDRGEFDNLPGAGEPIDLTENPFEALSFELCIVCSGMRVSRLRGLRSVKISTRRSNRPTRYCVELGSYTGGRTIREIQTGSGR